ncbi:armadillo-type protein [Lipomyces japonicus]|uniref:armadillo-type protein n=1 Tax=Lipomyces japonicus TaxID=56871 RepID=UPI0034CDD3ED
MTAFETLSQLDFDAPLAPKTSRSINVSEQLKRLKNVHNQLAQFEQGMVDLDSLKRVVNELISPNLLHHKDKGVRAFVACCLADVLRLFVPDAPYTGNQLQNIFEHFVNQLKGLSDTESPYFSQYCYLLENLSQVKSVVLMADLPNGDDLMIKLFQLFFDIANPDGLKNLEFHMAEILVQLVEESHSIPSEVVDMIMAQFLRPSAINESGNGKGKFQVALYQLPQAYNIAKTICIGCSDRISRNISQYFSEIIMSISSADGSNDEISETEFKELKKAHNLMVEIWKAAPEVLQNVIPQLEQEMLVENIQMRTLATQTTSFIAGEVPGRINFISAHPTCWEAWLGRQNDKNSQIRAKWAEGCTYILANRTDVVKGIIEGLTMKLIDSDERVRLSTIKAIGQLDYKTIINKLRDENLLTNLAERAKDKRPAVRIESIALLGKLYDLAYDDIATQDNEIVSQLGWIPDRILDLFYLNEKDVNVLIDHCIFEQLLPFELDDTKRVIRMLNFLKFLSERSRKAFDAIPARQKQVASGFEIFIQSCEKYNGSIIDDNEKEINTKLNTIIDWFAKQFSDVNKAELNLKAFAKLNDRRLYKLIRDCINTESDYKTVQKSINEIKSRLKRSQSNVAETLTPLLYRGAIIFYNKSNVHPVVEISKQSHNILSAPAHEILKNMTALYPEILKSHIHELTFLLQNQNPGFDGSVDTLKTYSEFSQKFPDNVPQTQEFFDSLFKYATEGSPEEAKHAVRIILNGKRKHAYSRDLLSNSVKFETSDRHFLTQLVSLSELMRGSPAIVEPEIDSITDFILSTVILKNRVKESDENNDWVEDKELDDDCKAKILGLRVLVSRLQAAATADTAAEIGKPVIKLFITLIENSGEVSIEKDTPLHYKSRLRLQAGLFILKLARLPIYDKLISALDISRVSRLAQDPNFAVRQLFIDKLKKYLAAESLPERYSPVLFLMAYEPEEEIKDELVTWIRARLAKQDNQKAMTLEKSFSRLLYLLAHHPDYGSESDDLLDLAQYIIFYLNSVVTEKNISLIFYFAQRVKQVRDALAEDLSERLYYLSDLSQAIIRHYQEINGWSMQTWPGKVPLPGDLFRALPNSAVAQKIARKTFLTDGVVERLPGLIKIKQARAKPLPPPPSSSSASSSAVKPAAKTNDTPQKSTTIKKRKPSERPTRKRKAKRVVDSSDDENDEDYIG